MRLYELEDIARRIVRDWVDHGESRGSKALFFFDTKVVHPSGTKTHLPICRLLNPSHGGLAVVCEAAFGERIEEDLEVDAAASAIVAAALESGAEDITVAPHEIPPFDAQMKFSFLAHSRYISA